jgi:high-affinity iron transporter
MLASFLLSLREGLEAALIIGIVLGVLLKLGRTDLSVKVWQGVALAISLSIGAAITLNLLGLEFKGRGEEIFEGSAMLLAAGVLTWMILWMREHGGNLKSQIEAQTRQATSRNGQKALFALSFLAVLREGIELSLFLLAARLASNPAEMLSGAVLGLVTAFVFGWILFASTKKLSLRRFFGATNILLVVFAAGMVGLGIQEFNEARIIPAIVEHAWDFSPILDENSGVGQLLKAMVGYNSSPSLTSVIGYSLYLIGIISYMIVRKRGQRLTQASVQAN